MELVLRPDSLNQHRNQVQSVQERPTIKESNSKLSINDFLYVHQYISQRYFQGTAPVEICNLITSYLFDFNQAERLMILPLKNFTNTLMLECSHILFNEFSLQETFFIQILQQMLERKQIPKQLIRIKSKKFSIDLNLPEYPHMSYMFQKNSAKNEMNSSIYFEMQSTWRKDKIYKILMFRKGKINIPGVNTLYQLSEVQIIIQILLKFYTNLTKVAQTPQIVVNKLTLCNYSTKLNIPGNQRLNLAKIGQKVNICEQTQQFIVNICQKYQTECMSFEFLKDRILLQLIFKLDKQIMPFVNFNNKSTSQRKKYRSITMKITQRGCISILGANDQFEKTNNILQALQEMINKIFSDFLYTPLI